MKTKDVFKSAVAAVAISAGLTVATPALFNSEAQAQTWREEQRFRERQQRQFEREQRQFERQQRRAWEQQQRALLQQQQRFGGFGYHVPRRRNNDAGAAAAGAAIGIIGGLILNEALRGPARGNFGIQSFGGRALPPPPHGRCSLQDAFDRYGNYLGQTRVCAQPRRFAP